MSDLSGGQAGRDVQPGRRQAGPSVTPIQAGPGPVPQATGVTVDLRGDSQAPIAAPAEDASAGAAPSPELPRSTPRQAVAVTIYHILCTIAALALIVVAYRKVGWFVDPVFRTAAFSIGAGIAGGTLTASRYVVYSVRHRAYDPCRMLWQLMTPLHSGIFAGFSLALGQAGLVIASEQLDSTAPGYVALVISLSFLIGFSSELFVKRLIAASEALFGESNGLEGAGMAEKRKKKKTSEVSD